MSNASPPGAIAPGLSRRGWATLLVLSAVVFLDALDVSMVGVALPSIRTNLHMSTSSLQWVVSAYVLGYGGFLLLGGRAADLLGRRRVLLIALAVFVVASALGGLTNDGTLLIATRFIKGVSAAFTAPAAFSIITTTFEEGPARNKALSVYTATAASGFSLGLVAGGLLTEIGWRWALLVPAPIALAALIAAFRLVPMGNAPVGVRARVDVLGAVLLTSGMLLLVYTLVETASAGWGSLRTLGSFAAVAALLAAFVRQEQRAPAPLIRLGILRSSTLVRANVAAIVLAGWIGFQFVATLYMQQLRGWSSLETGLAIFPTGLLVVFLSPRVALLIGRVSVPKLAAAGLGSLAIGYALFLPIGLDSSYAWAMLPTFLFGGLGFALAFGPINVAATAGVAPEEQGLAGGLLNTSFQFGAALVLAVVTAVANAATGSGGTPQATLDGFHAALFVPLAAAAVGSSALLLQRRRAAEFVELPVVEEVMEEAA
ncbi:MAG: transporter [Actinomycetia bacterium]|nr:transporter [Actinomycetes bacterium]